MDSPFKNCMFSDTQKPGKNKQNQQFDCFMTFIGVPHNIFIISQMEKYTKINS